MCPEEDSASVEWARQKDENWVNKDITSLEFVENIFRLMNWNRECRYKVLGRVANSDQGLCMLFDLEEAIMFTPKPQEYTDPLTGEMKKKQMKFFPDAYKNRIGKSYNDYIADHQMNMFEDFIGYQSSTVLDEPEREAGTTSIGDTSAGRISQKAEGALIGNIDQFIGKVNEILFVVYVGNSIIKDNIFAVIQNYARKKEIALELLRYPIHDDELWALTFLKQDTIFVCVNTALPLCKQFFAAAHELYHIYCYVENADQSYIKNGSMLDSATGDETGRTQEDLEANAFAGLLLMPDQLLREQILLYGLDKDLVTVDSVLMLMDMFAMPYKAVVLRLFESGTISHQQAEKLLEVGSADVMERVSSRLCYYRFCR